MPLGVNYSKIILRDKSGLIFHENVDYSVEFQTTLTNKNFIIIQELKDLDKIDEVLIFNLAQAAAYVTFWVTNPIWRRGDSWLNNMPVVANML